MPARLTLLALAAALPGAAAALTLGEAQLRSPLGAPLDVRIPVTRERGEPLEAACITIASPAVEGATPLADVDVALHRGPGRTELRVRSASAVTEAATAIVVRVACPRDTPTPIERLYVLLPSPAKRQDPAAPPADASLLSAREGDSLASLARALGGPRERRAGDWLARLRATNPALADRGDDAPLEPGARVAIPRPGALRRPALPVASPAPREVAASPAPPPVLAEAPPAPKASTPRPRAQRPASPSPVARPAPASERAATAAAPDGFVLKLSAPEVDLSRSRLVDDQARRQLRERQRVLDADDQVAALLAMQNTLRHLESRVAELQLKLSALPPAAPPAPTPRPAPAPAASPAAAAPAPTPAPAPVAAPSPPAVAPSSPGPASTEPAVERPAAARPASAKPRPDADGDAPWPGWLWPLAALLAIATLATLWWIRRPRARPGQADVDDPPAAPDADAFDLGANDPADLQARPALPTDAMLATRLPEDSGALRRRYIEERFPEVVNGTIVLDDPASIVKGARLFYEDGALPRAVELLQFAVEERPGEPRPWLALFEIFRLERLTGEYAELARRFREHHGGGDAWRKVRYFGREIDPGNPLYREDTVNTLETIGPREGRRLAAAMAAVDPIAENWLDAPMDFENEVLANELRNALMARANLSDADLVPNPMPALRHVEMFTVA